MRTKIEKANFKLIEAELYCYEETKKELEQLKDEIIQSSTYQEVAVQTGTTGDTTASKALKLVSSSVIMEMERRINVIEKVLDMFKDSPLKLELIKLKYFERRYTDIGIAQKLNISEKTFYRWKKEIIQFISMYLGYKI